MNGFSLILVSISDTVIICNICVDIPLSQVRVDGGLLRSDLLIQFQADLLEIEVARAANLEATSKGAAMAAAYGVGMCDAGIMTSDEDVVVFRPKMSKMELEKKRKMWKKAIERSMAWIKPDEIGDSSESSEVEF